MTAQTTAPTDFVVGEKIGPFCGEMATVLTVSPDSITFLMAGEEVTISPRQSLSVPVRLKPVKVSLWKKMASFFS